MANGAPDHDDTTQQTQQHQQNGAPTTQGNPPGNPTPTPQPLVPQQPAGQQPSTQPPTSAQPNLRNVSKTNEEQQTVIKRQEAALDGYEKLQHEVNELKSTNTGFWMANNQLRQHNNRLTAADQQRQQEVVRQQQLTSALQQQVSQLQQQVVQLTQSSQNVQAQPQPQLPSNAETGSVKQQIEGLQHAVNEALDMINEHDDIFQKIKRRFRWIVRYGKRSKSASPCPSEPEEWQDE